MKIERGKHIPCGAYDPWWVTRNVRHLIYKRYKQSVPSDFLEELFEIIEMGEKK